MAQQTQITRVVPAWTAFLERYPTPSDLAGSDRAELIRLWGGLGYQRRAFNLQRAARQIERGGWPADVDGLMALPGVGPYTAAAVACFPGVDRERAHPREMVRTGCLPLNTDFLQ